MALLLDHVYAFVPADFVDSAAFMAVSEFGLRASFGREHPGQGTANRLALFPGTALEFLWLTDAAEAAGNPLRLDRRAAGPDGPDPFGLCLRGDLGPALRERMSFHPMPGFALGGLYLAPGWDDPAQTMVFAFDTEEDLRPVSLAYPASLFEHPGGFTAMDQVTLSLAADAPADWLEVLDGALPTNLRVARAPSGTAPELHVALARSANANAIDDLVLPTGRGQLRLSGV